MTINSKKIFEFFNEICNIPHGSGNMEKISEFCVEFAKNNNLKYVRDDANNVIIFKDGTSGFEDSEPIILQGHIDMVCQKTEEKQIDFEKDPIEVFKDGDFLKANGTTLGADNGIAVAMIMTILASDDIPHPPIEAVFTTDEEIGMIGATALDCSILKAKKMINIDSGKADNLTVSCAGGSDFKIKIPTDKITSNGTKVTIEIKDLLGGHSGVEIHKGRINSNILLGRILNHVYEKVNFEIISINGGTKKNVIPSNSKAELLVDDTQTFSNIFETYKLKILEEITPREPNCDITLSFSENSEQEVLEKASKEKILFMLLLTPNGVLDMSVQIENLVETSLNLGIVKTNDDNIIFNFALRSNKETALCALEDKMCKFAIYNNCSFDISGRYSPWEFIDNSNLQKIYTETFYEVNGKKPNVIAVHAGLECAVFSSKIKDIDCISIGPNMYDIHSFNERLSISSTENIFTILCNLLIKCK